MNDFLALLRAGLAVLKDKLLAKKHLLALGALGAAFLLAAFIPLAFINNASGEKVLDYASRAQMFIDYWSVDDSGYVVEKIVEPTAEQLQFCAERFEQLISACRVDRAENIETKMEGSEYVLLRSADSSVSLCRKWIQYSGDWNNWLDVCFDMQTGEIFYLYTNGECIYNSGEYTDVSPGSTDALSLAQTFAEKMGLQLYYCDAAASGGDTATAIYLCGGVPIKVELSLSYYEGRLFNVKIVCVK